MKTGIYKQVYFEGGATMKKEEMSGTMANSMEELEKLGKEMEQMHEQQTEDHRERDPKQFDSEEK